MRTRTSPSGKEVTPRITKILLARITREQLTDAASAQTLALRNIPTSFLPLGFEADVVEIFASEGVGPSITAFQVTVSRPGDLISPQIPIWQDLDYLANIKLDTGAAFLWSADGSIVLECEVSTFDGSDVNLATSGIVDLYLVGIQT